MLLIGGELPVVFVNMFSRRLLLFPSNSFRLLKPVPSGFWCNASDPLHSSVPLRLTRDRLQHTNCHDNQPKKQVTIYCLKTRNSLHSHPMRYI